MSEGVPLFFLFSREQFTQVLIAPCAGFSFRVRRKINAKFPLLRVEPAEDVGQANRHQSGRPRAGSTLFSKTYQYNPRFVGASV